MKRMHGACDEGVDFGYDLARKSVNDDDGSAFGVDLLGKLVCRETVERYHY